MGRVMRWLVVLMLVAVLPAGAVRAGDSPVAKAARAGDLAAVRKLITTRADVNIPEGDGSTALLWAAYSSDVEMLRVLIAAGAKIDTANHYGDAVASGKSHRRHGRCGSPAKRRREPIAGAS